MPNVLLTFEEIADLFHCDAAAARSLVIENQWERRRWGDGLPRVQVPAEVAHHFMVTYAAKFEWHLPPARGPAGGTTVKGVRQAIDFIGGANSGKAV